MQVLFDEIVYSLNWFEAAERPLKHVAIWELDANGGSCIYWLINLSFKLLRPLILEPTLFLLLL